MIEEIKRIRTKCAKFYKIDLHLHSPLSACWKNNETPLYQPIPALNRISAVDSIKEDNLKAYAEILVKKKMGVVAITDHMRYSFAAKLADYVQKNHLDIIVFPGIELKVKINQPLIKDFGIHILAIFPPDIGDKIERIFPPKIKDESGRKGDEEIECDKIDDLLTSIKDIGGISIAAHIYSNPNGLRYAYTKSAELILEPLENTDPKQKEEFYKRVGDAIKNELFKFDALQVKSTTEPIHFSKENGDLFIPLVLATDSHHVDTIGADDNISFIKLGRSDFKCLKEAFKFPDTRIRFKANLPECHSPRILGVRVIGKQNNKRAFFKNLIVGFSDNLTCVIGPRGSGKSALIDAIRYAMGYNRTLNEIEKLKDQITDRQDNTLEETQIEILYQKSDGTIHKIQSTYDNRELYNTKVFDLEGNELSISDIEKSGDYPLNLYGWNELELLGENPRSQRENLDKFIKELIALKENKNTLYQKLVENRKKCGEQLDALDKYFNLKPGQYSFIRLKEYESEFQKLNTPEIATKFKDLDEITHKLGFLEKIDLALGVSLDAISNLKEMEHKNLLADYREVSSWCNEFIKRLSLETINDELLKVKGLFEGKLNSIKTIIDKEKATLVESKNEIFKTIRAVIGQEDAISIDLRDSAKKRLDIVKEQFESYKKDLEKLQNLFLEREKLVGDIKDANKRIFATRNAEISKIEARISIVNDKEFSIALRLNQAYDKADFLLALEENKYNLAFRGHWKNNKIPYLIAAKSDPFSFSEIVMNKKSGDLIHRIRVEENNISVDYSLDAEFSRRFIEENCPFEEIPNLQVKKYDKEKILRLLAIQEISFDDEFYIELGGKPIQHCSPGQRCSAMLPIVTLTSSAPIIIDQPEDNLDNRLVSRAIFKILAKLKETRQIIVATHNPNIPVSGDAEQIIVFNHNGTVKDYGSIDEPSVIGNIIELMEGGKEAFEKRQKRYVSYL